MKWFISVPASTANLGPGFDSIGVALDKYLRLEVEETVEWKIENLSENLPVVGVPTEHLIVKSAILTAKIHGLSLTPYHLKLSSEIPLARGMGSSASAIVAGIELANQALDLQLTDHDKLKIATNMEGHPDNVAASIYGGFTISSSAENGEIHVFHAYHIEAAFVLFIPEAELKTEEARKVLPNSYKRSIATQASANANLLTAAFLTESFEQAGIFMEQDLFHEPYRLSLISEAKDIRRVAKEAGAFGTCVSGAGPSLLSLVPKGEQANFITHLESKFPRFKLEAASISKTGIVVEKTKKSSTVSSL